MQYEIPESMLKDYSRVVCEANRGDMYLFDRNIVHSSASNVTDSVSFALVLRVWDFKDDLTLSGEMKVTPYSGQDIGRAGLMV